jgi:hypothetical protein
LKHSKTSRIVKAFSCHKKPDKEGLLKCSLNVFIVTGHKIVTNGHICDHHNVTDFVILKLAVTKSLKKLAKTKLLKPLKQSKTSRIVTAFNHHKPESQTQFLGCCITSIAAALLELQLHFLN